MRRPIKRRIEVKPDIKYQSVLVAKLINRVMKNGKKSLAEKIVYTALEKAEKELKKAAIDVLDKVVENAGPQWEIRSRRVGGANYQVPYEVKNDRRITLALRWVVQAARSQKGKTMIDRISKELIDAYNNEGIAVKKKSDMHRMASANKAFAHFAW